MRSTPQSLVYDTNFAAAAESFGGGEDGKNIWSHYALQVSEIGGTATSWTVTLQSSIDGSTWTDLTTHVKATEGNGKVKNVTDKVAPLVRLYCTALTFGTATSIDVRLVAI